MSGETADVVERVTRLIALAVDPAASDAEARTSALIACRSIRSQKLLLLLPGANAQSYAAGYRDGVASVRSPPPPPPPTVGRRVIRSRFDGWCRYCGIEWSEGDLIAWAHGLGATCLDCRETDP